MTDIFGMIGKLFIGLHGSLRCLTYPLRRREMLSRRIVACVFSIGERTEQDALASVKRQSVPIHHIELIRDVAPISAASNRALDLAKDFDYLLWVDADMILADRCAERLLMLMKDDVLYALAPLEDPVFGRVGYIKLVNMAVVRSLGLRFRDVLGCDIDLCSQVRAGGKGLKPEIYTFPRYPLGIHHPTYTARELFRKCQIERKKRGNTPDMKILGNLVRSYERTGSPVLLAGILGEILPNRDPAGGESGPRSGMASWELVRDLLGRIPDTETYGFPEHHRDPTTPCAG